ncbi:hypothetical protein KJ966_21655 [bacterium]|nr:hypothetical protein [bacterium]
MIYSDNRFLKSTRVSRQDNGASMIINLFQVMFKKKNAPGKPSDSKEEEREKDRRVRDMGRLFNRRKKVEKQKPDTR